MACKSVLFAAIAVNPKRNAHITTAEQRTTHSNTVIGRLPLMGGLFGTARRGLGGLRPAQAAPRCTKCNRPPINGQCTNFISFDVAV